MKNIIGADNIRTAAGIAFVVLGTFFLYRMPVPNQNSDSLKKEPISASAEFKKTNGDSIISRIIIPGVDIDLSVKPSKIVGGYWETSDINASHGEGSVNPGENGNVVVFAHAREGLFYNLKDTKKDDTIYVLTKKGGYRYKVSEIKTVYPNNIETVAPTDQEVLTLFTCSGFFDEKRLIVKAFPIPL